MACIDCNKLVDGVIGLAKAAMIAAGSSVDAAPAEAVKARRDICRGCSLRSDAGQKQTIRSRCTHPNCGCFIAARTLLASKACPLTPPKWGAVELARKDGSSPV